TIITMRLPWESVMFSKHQIFIVSSLLSILTFLSLAGCDRFLHGSQSDKDDPNRTVVINTKEVDCLQTMPVALQKFVDDQATSLTPTVQCLKTVLHTFQRRFKGANDNYYKSQELQHFLNRYLLQKNQISDGFLFELMKLKVVMVGGEQDKITRDEIDQISKFIDDTEPYANSLAGQMKMIFFRETDASKVQNFAATKKNLLDFSKFVLSRTQVTQSRYEFIDLKSFATELDQFLNNDSSSLKSLLHWLPLAESIKLVFLGDHAKLYTNSEWADTTQWMVDAYIDVLEFYYDIKDLKLQSASEWNFLMAWVDRSFDLVEKSPAMQEKRVFDADALDKMIDGIWGLNLFKINLSAALIKDSYKKALVHFIQGQPGGQGSALTIDGITDEHLRLIRMEYHVWKMTQLALDDLYLKKSDWSVPELRHEIQTMSPKDLIQRVGGSSLEQEELLHSWQDFVTLFSLKPVVVYNTNFKMTTMYNNDLVRTNFSGMSMLNVTKSVIRLIFRGYGDHSSPFVFATLMPQVGMVQFEEDFREFGRAIGFLDPRETDSAVRTFKEGNFFSYHGNGDQFLSSTEFYEQINMLITGGSLVVGNIYDDMKTQGCLTTDKDVFGKQIAVEDCFVKLFRKNLKVYLGHIPWMAQYLSQLSEAQFTQAYQLLMTVGRLPTSRPNRVEWSEIRTLTTVLQYVESIYTIYDTDR